MPVATILALVLLFSAYMLVDGAFAVYAAIRAGQQGDSWGLLAFQGITSLVAGVLAFLWPGITVLAFVLLIAAWSIVTGCVMLAAALATEQARWWLVVGGAAAMLFGILMIVAPLAGAVVLTWWLGAYALVFGVALIILAFKLRSRYQARYQDRGTTVSARPVA
ncbi:MAG: HdeD family acid-resistance protein [Xanthobacteraceae bacterium]